MRAAAKVPKYGIVNNVHTCWPEDLFMNDEQLTLCVINLCIYWANDLLSSSDRLSFLLLFLVRSLHEPWADSICCLGKLSSNVRMTFLLTLKFPSKQTTGRKKLTFCRARACPLPATHCFFLWSITPNLMYQRLLVVLNSLISSRTFEFFSALAIMNKVAKNMYLSFSLDVNFSFHLRKYHWRGMAELLGNLVNLRETAFWSGYAALCIPISDVCLVVTRLSSLSVL